MEKIDIIKGKLEEIRPMLNLEGGDVEFIKYDDETKTLYVKMTGACAMCSMQDETLEYGLLEWIKEDVEDLKNIVNVPL